MPENFTLVFTESAKKGIRDIMGDLVVFSDFRKVLNKIRERGKQFGIPLENKLGMNLEGCNKVYFGNTQYRVVFMQEHRSIRIITVLAVGRRKDLEAYEEAIKELKTLQGGLKQEDP